MVVAWLEIQHWFRETRAHEVDAVGDVYELFVRIPDRSLTIGRTGGGNGPHIACDEDTLSRRHMEIVPAGEGHAIRDLQSTGGTFINTGRLLSSEGLRPLANGDCIHFGAPGRASGIYHRALDHAFDDVEVELAIAVRYRVAGARIIYADWLEQRGDHARAQFLRDREDADPLGPGEKSRAPTIAMYRSWLAIDPSWRVVLLPPHVSYGA